LLSLTKELVILFAGAVGFITGFWVKIILY